MDKKNGQVSLPPSDRDIIEGLKQQLIKTFEALPDCIAMEVFEDLKERGML